MLEPIALLAFTSRKPLTKDEPFVADSYLFITAGTFQKRPFAAGAERKALLLESLDFNCYKWQWRILAYVILDNHYHLVVQTPPGDPSRLAHVVQSAHSFSAYHWRKEDPSIKSRVWWNFWDASIPAMDSLRTHINYVHENPRYHGVTDQPAEYASSSYADYLKLDTPTLDQWERENPITGLNVIDAF